MVRSSFRTESMDPMNGPYRIRKLWPVEGGAFRRHLLRLDAETRQFRFDSAVLDWSVTRS